MPTPHPNGTATPTKRRHLVPRPKVRLVYQDLEFIRRIILGADDDEPEKEALLIAKIETIMAKMKRAYEART